MIPDRANFSGQEGTGATIMTQIYMSGLGGEQRLLKNPQ